MITLPSFEKMGLFYLGRELAQDGGTATSGPAFLLPGRELTTHAVILGMTGSGKTGLGVALLEEAAMDRIPAIVIDPKGDLANLGLTFPDLLPEDFLPWIASEEAHRQGLSVEELAGRTAEAWRGGLAEWGQDGERIRRLRRHSEVAVFTPGAHQGRRISLLHGLEAPGRSQGDEAEDEALMSALADATTRSLLGLLGVDADPLQSKEYILLSSLMLHYWRRLEDLTLPRLVHGTVQPPFSAIGALPLEGFYPRSHRMQLAMRLNALVASPRARAWLAGDPLDIGRLLFTTDGKARISVFTLAHLEDRERMFFVTRLLGAVLSWMRRQEGSETLRLLLYMDEIHGFFPPRDEPPTKRPMLLLLKQARAFGVGVVLATQNPVDLDYRGLANIGSYFIGRLRTRQDQDRVLDGIASGGRLKKERLRQKLRSMPKRAFLLSSVYRPEVVHFQTRWVMSYLKGPMTLADIARLETRGADHSDSSGGEAALVNNRRAVIGSGPWLEAPPPLPAGVIQVFGLSPVPVAEYRYRPALVGRATVRYFDQRRGIDQESSWWLKLDAAGDQMAVPSWTQATSCDQLSEIASGDGREPMPAARFYAPAPWLSDKRQVLRLRKALADHLYHQCRLPLFRVVSLKMESRPGESRSEFLQRVRLRLRREREARQDALLSRYEARQQRIRDRMARLEARLEKERTEAQARGVDTLLAVGVAVLGALFGGRKRSVATVERVARGVRSGSRLKKEKADVKRVEEELTRVEQQLDALAVALQEKMEKLAERFSEEHHPVTEFVVRPRRSDIRDVELFVLWEPELPGSLGSATGTQPADIVAADRIQGDRLGPS